MNVPLGHVAGFLAALGRAALVECVPKDDSQVRRLLSSRADVLPEYTRDGFERAFATVFDAVAVRPIQGSARVLYLFRHCMVPQEA